MYYAYTRIQSSSSLSVWKCLLCIIAESWKPIYFIFLLYLWLPDYQRLFFILKQPLNFLSLYIVSSTIIKLHRLVLGEFEGCKDEGNATKELIKVKRYSRLRNVLNGCSLLKPLEWSTVPPEKHQPCVRVSGCQGPIFRSEAWAYAPPLSLAHPLQVLLHKTPLSSFLYMGEGLSSNWISLFVWLFLLVCSYTPHLSVCLFFLSHFPPSPLSSLPGFLFQTEYS